jgi:hypothetical protein
MVFPGGSLTAGKFFDNPDSTCTDKSYTLAVPGTAGGFTTGKYQPNPAPATLLLLVNPPFGGSVLKTADRTLMSHSGEDRLLFGHAFSDRGPGLRVGESLGSQSRRTTVRGTARPEARGSSREASADRPRGRRSASRCE